MGFDGLKGCIFWSFLGRIPLLKNAHIDPTLPTCSARLRSLILTVGAVFERARCALSNAGSMFEIDKRSKKFEPIEILKIAEMFIVLRTKINREMALFQWDFAKMGEFIIFC